MFLRLTEDPKGRYDAWMEYAGGTPVENVHAVGNEDLGALNESNRAYVTCGGCARGWSLTSGRLAGASAAAKFAG